MNSIICDAISRRAVISIYYDGGQRIVEPHCHGTSKTGHEVLRGYQTSGYSTSGKPIGWKLFEVAHIKHLSLTEETFAENRQFYNPKDKGMRAVHCHV